MQKLAKKSEVELALSHTDTSPFLYCDGVTTSRAQIQTPGGRGNLAGVPVASWVGWVDVPDTSLAANRNIVSYGASANNTPTPGFRITIYSNSLFIDQIGSNGNRQAVVSGFRSTYSGQRIWLNIRLTNGTTLPTITVNGISVSVSNGTDSGTIPDWLDAGISATYITTGVDWPAGTMPMGCWINAHLTDAESETWRTTGKPPIWVVTGGSCANILPNGTFEVDASGWAGLSDGTEVFSVTRNTVSPISGNGDLSLNVTTGSSLFGNYPRASYTATPLFVSGGRYRITGKVRRTSGTATQLTVRSGPSGASLTLASVILDGSIQTFSGSLDVLGTANVGNLTFIPIGPLGWTGQIEFDDIEVYRLGALSLPAVQSINVLRDWTMIGGNPSRLFGISPINVTNFKSDITIGSSSYTTGTSVQILGGGPLTTSSRRQRIISISGNSSASVNLSLGTTSGGTQLVNAQAVNGDFDISTFVSRIIGTSANLWITFSGNTTATVSIKMSEIVT